MLNLKMEIYLVCRLVIYCIKFCLTSLEFLAQYKLWNSKNSNPPGLIFWPGRDDPILAGTGMTLFWPGPGSGRSTISAERKTMIL